MGRGKNREGKYIVELPDIFMNLPGWAEIPRIGRIFASGERQAVSAYVMKYAPMTGRVILTRLSNDGPLERCAFTMPDFEPVYAQGSFPRFAGKRVTQQDRDLLAPYVLASEIAGRADRDNPTDQDLGRANYLLQASLSKN